MKITHGTSSILRILWHLAGCADVKSMFPDQREATRRKHSVKTASFCCRRKCFQTASGTTSAREEWCAPSVSRRAAARRKHFAKSASALCRRKCSRKASGTTDARKEWCAQSVSRREHQPDYTGFSHRSHRKWEMFCTDQLDMVLPDLYRAS